MIFLAEYELIKTSVFLRFEGGYMLIQNTFRTASCALKIRIIKTRYAEGSLRLEYHLQLFHLGLSTHLLNLCW